MGRVIRESCEGCCKEIYTHNPVVICQFCSKIVHSKCSSKLKFVFDADEDFWLCYTCFSEKAERYNPFKTFNNYYKHNPDQNVNDDDILRISSVMKTISNLFLLFLITLMAMPQILTDLAMKFQT